MKMDRIHNGRLQNWLLFLVSTLSVLRTESLLADITYVQTAVAKGAVCLDGSPPAYHFDKGFGTGINNWIVHVDGGGWCNNVMSCLNRKNSPLGSSTKMDKQLYFSGILSNGAQFNPDFYNWNRVKIGYCDGGSFTGDIEAVDPATNLHYRGARIFPAVIEDLLEKGMRNAQNAILSGCSAGGLTTFLHCDSFKALLPKSTKVKCLADAGYFINAKDISGAPRFEQYFDDVVRTHGSAKNLPQSCTSKMKPSLCFFPENFARGIQTPLFVLNSAIDSWQIRYILSPAAADPRGLWTKCNVDITKCSPSEIQRIKGYESEFINALTGLGASTSRGYFINSCFAHCQTEPQAYWFGSNTPMLNNKTIAKAVGDWFYERSPFQQIDCPYPCDRTCHQQALLPEEYLLDY